MATRKVPPWAVRGRGPQAIGGSPSADRRFLPSRRVAGRAPGVEHGRDADPGAEALGFGGEWRASSRPLPSSAGRRPRACSGRRCHAARSAACTRRKSTGPASHRRDAAAARFREGPPHDVSILIGVGRQRGLQPRAYTSMTIMRAPQRRHGQGSTRGDAAETSKTTRMDPSPTSRSIVGRDHPTRETRWRDFDLQ